MYTPASYRRPATSGGGGDSTPWFHHPHLRPDSSSGKGRPSLTLKTYRSRSRSRISIDSRGNPRSRSLSPPPSSIISAAPTLVPSGFGTLPEAQSHRASFISASQNVGQTHSSSTDPPTRLISTTASRLKEPDFDVRRKSSSNDLPTTIPVPSSLPPNGEDSLRTRDAKSSLGFHSENGRSLRNPPSKHYQLALKDGRRLHTNNLEKAPYPLSYDKSVLGLECLNNRWTRHLRRGSISFIEYSNDPSSDDLPLPPERCLDLGCGMGTWIVDAAKEWTDCTFVGFDLISNQVPTYLLEEKIAPRVEWVHGNFLTTKLPFEDEEFDHIHIHMVGMGVPENKWPYLFEEINRVLSPGGAIEMLDEDVIFPMAQTFLSALRPAQPRPSFNPEPRKALEPPGVAPMHRPNNSLSSQSSSYTLHHDHALLEDLYMSVFDRRFINTKPTAMLPSYFTTYFRKVIMSPVLSFSMPPLPPPKPRAPTTASSAIMDSIALSSPTSAAASLPERPESQPLSRTLSGQSSDSSVGLPDVPHISPERARSSSDASMRSIAQVMISPSEIPPVPPLPGAPTISSQDGETSTADATLCDSNDLSVPPHFHPYYLEADDMSSDMFNHLFDRTILNSLRPRALCMHLYHSYSLVLACQDAMWEELKYRLLNSSHDIKEHYGWDIEQDDSSLSLSREKFEGLLTQFREDMEKRAAFWAEECEDFGWHYPAQDVLSKAEEMEDTRFRKVMDKIRRDVVLGQVPLDDPCRKLRVLVGFKD